MKKNITINIFGTVYSIDEDAYVLLNNYLEGMKSYFSNQLKSLTSIVRIYMFVGILGIFALLLVLIVRQYRPLSGLITLSARYGGEGDASNLYDYIGRTVQDVISAKNDADQRLAILHSAAKNTLRS